MPHHNLFAPDGYWLMEQGKNFMQEGKAEVCEYSENLEKECSIVRSTGYSAILSVPFITFGINNFVALYFSSIISGFLVIPLFFFVYLLLKNEKIALFSSLIIIFDKLNLVLSSYVENINPAIIIILCSGIFFFLYFKNKDLWSHLLGMFLFLMSIFIRIEYLLAGIIIFYMYLIKSRNDFNKNHFIMPVTIGVLIIIIYLVQVPVISSIGYNSDFGLVNLSENIKILFDNIEYYFGFVLSTLLVLGIFHAYNKYRKEFYIIFSSMIIFALFYFTWTQANIERLMMLIFVHLIIFMGVGLQYLFIQTKKMKQRKVFNTIILTLIIIILLSNVNIISDRISSSASTLANTEVIELVEEKVPENCFVIVERPVFITATTNIKAIPTSRIYKNSRSINRIINKTNCLLFFENDLCYEDIDAGPGRNVYQRNSTGRCTEIKNDYELEEIFTFSPDYQKRVYRLYNLSIKRNLINMNLNQTKNETENSSLYLS
ncbi:hypothetical protein ACFLTH_14305 [Bacteroidota bacterium]